MIPTTWRNALEAAYYKGAIDDHPPRATPHKPTHSLLLEVVVPRDSHMG